MKHKLINWEISVYALHLAGGVSRLVSTEDVALKCFEIAPESFSWVHYPQYPDKDIARVALTDARKTKAGALVVGRAGRGVRPVAQTRGALSTDGWMLSEAGVRWIVANEKRLKDALGDQTTSFHRQDLLKKLQRIRNHRLFASYQASPAAFAPSLGELADLLRCRVDADRAVWAKRFDLLRNQALLARQDEIVAFANKCEEHLSVLTGKEGMTTT